MVVHLTSSSERIAGCSALSGSGEGDLGGVTGTKPVPALLTLERRERGRGGDGSRMDSL